MFLLRVTLILMCAGDIYSGQSGYITLINETESEWELMEQQSFQMNTWNFPKKIGAKSVSHVYVEWSQEIFHRSSNDNGTAIYRFVGSGDQTIKIRALAIPFRIEIVLQNFAIDGRPQLSEYNLGWEHNGDVTFVLIEHKGRYTGTNMNATDWMKNHLDILGNKTLKEICIPGTHASGMSVFGSRSTLFSHPCNTLTQSRSVKGQLELGTRYFDIRPIISEGEFMAGHYERIPGSWQGGNGQSMKSIVGDINEFAASSSEVVIVSLSHSLNTDLKPSQYRKFNQSEWNSLFDLLDRTNSLYYNEEAAVNLQELTINHLTSRGQVSSIIFIIRDLGVDLGERLGKGYFHSNNLNIYDVYANTHKLLEMTEDQINKMIEYSKDYYFLLSWTLTQNVEEAVLCSMSSVKSVKDLAEEANNHLAFTLYPNVSPSSFPNVISIDDVKNTDVTAIAMAINKNLNSF